MEFSRNFIKLVGKLTVLFIGISFFVGIIQQTISGDKIKGKGIGIQNEKD